MHRKKQISQFGWNDRTTGYEEGPSLVGFLLLQTQHNHKYLGEERVGSFYNLQPIIRGNQTGTRGGWEPGIGAETETMKELCLHWLALCLTQLTTTCPGTALSSAGWALTSVINQENGALTCLQANVVRVFSQLRFLFPDDTELCQYTERQINAAPFLVNVKFLNEAKMLVEGKWGGCRGENGTLTVES